MRSGRPMSSVWRAMTMAAAPLRAEVSDAKWKEIKSAFKDDYSKKSIKFKKRAIEVLPVTDERTIHFLIKEKKLLSHKDWWIRGATAERLVAALVEGLHDAIR